MPYEEQKWVENITAANEAHLNHIEKGIIAEEAARIAELKAEETRALNAEKAAREAAELEANAKNTTEKARAEAAEALKIPLTQKGKPSGVAELEAAGKIPAGQLPALSINEVFTSASQAEMLATAAHTGDVDIRTDVKKQYILTKEPATVFGNWAEFTGTVAGVESVNGKSGIVTLAAVDVAADKEGEAKTEETRAKAAEKVIEEHTAGLAGGVATQALFKKSSAAYDFEWKVPAGGGGSGITPTELEEIQGVTYVKDFGAKGDGVTDDTVSIQNAITAMPAAGGILWLTAGKNYIVTTLKAKTNMVVWGYGARITQKANSTSLSIFYTKESEPVTNVSFYGIRFYAGAGQAGSNICAAITLEAGEEVTVRDCFAEGFKSSAFQFYGFKRAHIINNTVKKCAPVPSEHNAIQIVSNLAGQACSDILIDGNYIDQCGTIGIAVVLTKPTQLTEPLRIQVVNNIVRGEATTGAGIWMEIELAPGPNHAKEIIIANNHIEGGNSATSYGILCEVDTKSTVANQESDITISGNVVSTFASALKLMASRCVVSGNAIRCQKNNLAEIRGSVAAPSENIVVTGNYFFGGKELTNKGLYIANSNHVTVSDNRFLFEAGNSNLPAGISTATAHYVTIMNNVIEQAPGPAIAIGQDAGPCHDFDISGNRIWNPSTTGEHPAIELIGSTVTGENFNAVRNNFIVDDRGAGKKATVGVTTNATEKEFHTGNVILGMKTSPYSGTFKTVGLAPLSEHAFSINGTLAVEACPGYTVRLEGGEEKNIEAVDLRLEEGTECELTIRRNGSVLNATYEKIKLKKGTPQRLTKTVALADKDYIDLNILAITGAPGKLSVTLYERQVT